LPFDHGDPTTPGTYRRWLDGVLAKKLLVMEIGVGFNTLGIIRWPFERLVNIH
jgi:hypothetical protein